MQYRCLVQRTEVECQTVDVSLSHDSATERPTSRVKSPETPQEVVEAGAAVVEVDEKEKVVCVKGADPESGISSEDDVPCIVTVMVIGVAAGSMVSMMTVNQKYHTYAV